jgi:hypothetical protein
MRELSVAEQRYRAVLEVIAEGRTEAPRDGMCRSAALDADTSEHRSVKGCGLNVRSWPAVPGSLPTDPCPFCEANGQLG